MRNRRAKVAVAFLASLLLMGPAQAAQRPTQREVMGVPVMPGGVVVDGRILYEGGRVIVVPGVGDAFDSCPSGWVCLFDNVSWQGNLVIFSSCCAWENLADYGFNELASSWRNRKNVDAQIAMNANGGGSRLCLNNNSYSSTMPGGWDNTASSIRVRDASTYC